MYHGNLKIIYLMQLKWTSLHLSASHGYLETARIGYLETARILILGGANINAITVRLSIQ